jgi:hypothetical protein
MGNPANKRFKKLRNALARLRDPEDPPNLRQVANLLGEVIEDLLDLEPDPTPSPSKKNDRPDPSTE